MNKSSENFKSIKYLYYSAHDSNIMFILMNLLEKDGIEKLKQDIIAL